MLIIGHRGAAGLEPENTIRSFKKAQDSGAQMLECDLRRTSDGKIVLSHDRKNDYSDSTGLDELLHMATLPLDLEIKESGFENEVLESIKGFAHKVLITSWNPLVLKKIRALDGNIQLGLVIATRYGILLPLVISFLKKVNIFSISVTPELVNENRMSKFRELGWRVYVYTINTPEEFYRLKNYGVDGIFTDYPDIVSKLN
ncbi:MAG: glycerophosphodiester phosphodiesterase [Candidatus Doudnabacteria bacterium]